MLGLMRARLSSAPESRNARKHGSYDKQPLPREKGILRLQETKSLQDLRLSIEEFKSFWSRGQKLSGVHGDVTGEER